MIEISSQCVQGHGVTRDDPLARFADCHQFRDMLTRGSSHGLWRRRVVAVAGVISALAVMAGAAPAQQGALRGRILDAVSMTPIREASVTWMQTGRAAKTDSLGRFSIDGVTTGIQRFLVNAPGYARGTLVLAFARSEVIERDLLLDSAAVVAQDTTHRERVAQPLAPIPVKAEPSLGPRYADFERRRATGRGQYLTADDFERGGFMNLQDAMRNLRGTRLSCSGINCSIQMTRAPLGCNPDYVVDERVDNVFGPQVPVRDVQAVEVYSGASDVPGEFAGTNAGCGVIVIWTKNGRRSKKPG
jgi:hypothetical protein